LAISLLLSACGPATASPVQPTLSPGPATGWLQIYFTDPTAPHSRDYEGGPDEALAAAIDGGRLSVDVAAYSLNLWSIRDALIHAHQRGAVVRLVMESDNMEDQEVQDLMDAGIPVIGDQQEGLMHDKFVVIDRSEVWTGSMNYTVGGAYRDNNNLIRIRSVQVAQDYTNEFEEMFADDLFGPDGSANTPHPKLTIDGTQVEVYFSPDDGVAKRMIELVNGAQESIYFLAYSFTSNEIGDAMVERAQAGITVAGVMDDGLIASNEGTEYDSLLQDGLDVRQDGNTNGRMHHKVIIIDRQIVITGSYNFTANAEESNDENVVIIFSPDVTAKYLEEFQRVYGQAQQP
jgi:phosphatidylserine/phosphatidylglycerophosphate/cardiolipin synthase-like enzyme